MAAGHILPEICEGEGAEELDLGPVAAEERGDGSEEARAGLQGRDADHGLDAVRHVGSGSAVCAFVVARNGFQQDRANRQGVGTAQGRVLAKPSRRRQRACRDEACLDMAVPLLLLPLVAAALLPLPAPAPPPFRVVGAIAGRAASTHYAASVRAAGSASWTAALVLQTTARNASSLHGCGYFGHLDGWSNSFVNLELSGPVEVRITRLTPATKTSIVSAVVRPASSGATASVVRGAAVVAVQGESRFTVDFDGGMETTDTGPNYRGPPMHTFAVFANILDPNPPSRSDPHVLAIAPGDPLPLPGSLGQNTTTVLFLPGEHRPAAAPGGWAIWTLPPRVRIHVPNGAIVYAALVTGKWGAQDITVDGFGAFSGEEMSRCPNRTDVAAAQSCTISCPTNTSPQGMTLTGVTTAVVTGVTFIDFPNHHIIAQATQCRGGGVDGEGHAGIMSNVKVLGWRANGDGLHVFGSWKVSKMFMRTQDDSMYGL